MCGEESNACELVKYFLLRSGDLVQLFSVVVFGITVVFSLFGALVGLRCRRLLAGFAELSYEARIASVRSVDWGLSVGGGVLCVRGVRWVRGGGCSFWFPGVIIVTFSICIIVETISGAGGWYYFGVYLEVRWV